MAYRCRHCLLYVWFYPSGFAVLMGGEINVLLGELKNHRSLESFSFRAYFLPGEISGAYTPALVTPSSL